MEKWLLVGYGCNGNARSVLIGIVNGSAQGSILCLGNVHEKLPFGLPAGIESSSPLPNDRLCVGCGRGEGRRGVGFDVSSTRLSSPKSAERRRLLQLRFQ